MVCTRLKPGLPGPCLVLQGQLPAPRFLYVSSSLCTHTNNTSTDITTPHFFKFVSIIFIYASIDEDDDTLTSTSRLGLIGNYILSFFFKQLGMIVLNPNMIICYGGKVGKIQKIGQNKKKCCVCNTVFEYIHTKNVRKAFPNMMVLLLLRVTTGQ